MYVGNVNYSDHNKNDVYGRSSSCDEAGEMCQVMLYNDTRNEAFFVVRCLMQTFHHDTQLAIKIMMEAHNNGKAIAEVETAQEAKMHCNQLHSFGLVAEVISI